jgi:hypothetical protein
VPARRAGARGGRGLPRPRYPCSLRDLGRLRRGGRGRRRSTTAAARARPRARRPPDRSELPRPGSCGPTAERDLRPQRDPVRTGRFLVSERCARSGADRGRRGARARALGVRLDRQQGRRLVERPARVVGGGRGHRSGPALSGVVRKPAQVRAARPPRRPFEADPGDEERANRRGREGRELAHRRARRLGGRGRRALPPRGSAAGRDARGAARRRGAALVPAGAARTPRRAADERRRARDPVRGRLRRCRPGARAADGRDGDRAGAGAPRRGEHGEPRRRARLCDRGSLRGCAATPARRPAGRRCDRSLRASGDRRGRRGRGRRRARRPRLGEAGPRRADELRGNALRAAERRAARRSVPLSRVRGARARPRSRARRVVAPPRRLLPAARRDRSHDGRSRRRRGGRGLARRRADPLAPPCVRRPARRGAARGKRRRGSRLPASSASRSC